MNNDNEAAKDQFQKLRAEVNDASSQQMIDQYLTAINQRDQWKINGGISFLNESNINNAPKAGTRIGAWKAWEREQAHGLSYYVGAEKKLVVASSVFCETGFRLGKANIIGITKNITNLMLESVPVWVIKRQIPNSLSYLSLSGVGIPAVLPVVMP